MTFEIHANKIGKPFLKKVDRMRIWSKDGRATWTPIGHITDKDIERTVRINQTYGLIVLIDEDGVYRALILTD